ncbi:MAG: hypothetical protein N6V49_07635, partial [Serratia symbiotica]|nr:hypothetical protein [Serratia symbiotica]
VAHINKDQATEIAAAVDPTTQSDFLAYVGQIQLPAIFSTHTLSFLHSRYRAGLERPGRTAISDELYFCCPI